MNQGARIADLIARGAQLQAKGNFADALLALAEAGKTDPNNTDVVARLGALLMVMGRAAEALTCFDRLCELKRGEPAPVHDRCVALMALGRHAEGIQGFDLIIAAQPGFTPAHYNRGVAMSSLRRYDEALASYDEALKLDPNHLLALINRGVALQERGRPDEAAESFSRAIALDPRCAPAHCNMAKAMRLMNQPKQALTFCDQALAINPNYVSAMNERGVVLAKLGQLEPAVEVFRRTIELDPNYVEAHENLFVVLTELGRNDEAIGSIEEAIRLAPGRVRPYYNLTETRKIKQGDPRIPAMELIASRMDELGTTAQIEICFSLGKTYADLKDYDRSFPWLAKGCKLKRAITDYNEAGTLEMMRRAATAFDAKTLKKRAGVGEPSTSPVFILGMPRSGTTLVEQILASHPQVFAAGEIEAFLTGMIEAAAKCRSEDTPEAFAGLIQLALPGAKFIHVKRNPLDTCLSCFTKLFVSEAPYTYDLAELGRYYKGYEGLMAHWRKVMPAKSLIEVQYEDVVDDLETQAKRIIAHAGLDWDPACLEFHTTERPVRTASLMQVRQPIYTSAVQRWKTYEKHLGPLQEALGPA